MPVILLVSSFRFRSIQFCLSYIIIENGKRQECMQNQFVFRQTVDTINLRHLQQHPHYSILQTKKRAEILQKLQFLFSFFPFPLFFYFKQLLFVYTYMLASILCQILKVKLKKKRLKELIVMSNGSQKITKPILKLCQKCFSLYSLPQSQMYCWYEKKETI